MSSDEKNIKIKNKDNNKGSVKEQPQITTALTTDPARLAQMKAAKKRFHRRRRMKDWAMFTGYLTPSLVGVLLFFFLPLLMILKTSFQKSTTNYDFVGFENYNRVLSNDAFKDAALNTLKFSGIAVPLAVILALLLAMLLNSGIPAQSAFRSVLLNPMMVPVASIVLIWQVFFSYNGVANAWGFNHLFEPDKIDWLKSDHAQLVILVLFLWKNLGYNMVLFLAALNSIDEQIIESAMMDGAGSVRRFFSIKMFFLAPTIFFVAIMSLINSFKIFREVYLLTGDHPYTNLYMLQHFMNNAFKNLEYNKLSAGAIIMCVVMIVIVGALFFAEARFDSDVEG